MHPVLKALKGGNGSDKTITDIFSVKEVESLANFGNILLEENDLFKATGHLSITKNKDCPDEEILHQSSNLIVYNARHAMSRLIAGEGGGGWVIDQIAFGGGGHDTLNPTVALPEDPLSVGLTGPEFFRTNTTMSHPDGPNGTRTKFSVTMSNSDAVGDGLSEAGLFMNNSSLFAIKHFGLITKGAFSLTFEWTIIF